VSWQVRWQATAHRDLSRLDRQIQERIIAAVKRLAETGQGDVLRLTDIQPSEWRLRVGKWRVRFRRDDAARTLDVLRVLLRDKAY
jgi:mRNA-degrading endonuclease RelE of RelBE toxin-antitoxin system